MYQVDLEERTERRILDSLGGDPRFVWLTNFQFLFRHSNMGVRHWKSVLPAEDRQLIFLGVS
jgi:hypothetical protein